MTFEHVADLSQAIRPLLHLIDQIRAIERPDQKLGVGKPEFCRDVRSNMLRCRRRVRMHGNSWKGGLQAPQQAIVLAEIMSPTADAMGLIHRDKRDPDISEKLEHPLRIQLLERNIEQLQAFRRESQRPPGVFPRPTGCY